MARARQLSDADLRHLRLVAQALHRPSGLSAAQLVRHLAGVQAQVLSAAALALGARSSSLTAAAVNSARLDERSIVLCWAMRGTLHLVAAEDHGWIVPLTVEPSLANAYRRLKQEGVPPEQPERALRLIEAMLAREGPLTRAEIGEHLQRDGIQTAGQALPHLLWLAAADGTICSGPEKSGRQRFVLARDWLGGQPVTLIGDAALAEIAVRFLAAHAPAAPEDLAFWSGLRLADARAGWSSIRDRLAEVATPLGPLWTLRSRARPAQELVRLLPAFDEYLMGWKDRRLIASAEQWKAVNRGGGWVYPTLVYDGRLVATWRRERKPNGWTVELSPFAPLAAAISRGAESEAKRLASFLETAVELAPIRRR